MSEPVAPIASASAGRGVGRALLLFMGAQIVVIGVIAVVLTRFVWSSADAARAVQVSAWVAVVVQGITFAIARLVAREQVIAAWGLGVLLRFAVVAVWAFLAVPALGLTAGPALMSLVLFFFVSTLVEPLFLNVR